MHDTVTFHRWKLFWNEIKNLRNNDDAFFKLFTVQVNTEGAFYVSNGGLPNIYSTAQFHFHWGHKSHHGSEHTIDGVASPIEVYTWIFYIHILH